MLKRYIDEWEENVRALKNGGEQSELAERFEEETVRTFVEIQNSTSPLETDLEKAIAALQAEMIKFLDQSEENMKNLNNNAEVRYDELSKLAERMAEEHARIFWGFQNGLSTMATERDKIIVMVQADLIKKFNQLYQEERESIYNEFNIIKSCLATCPEDEEIRKQMVYEPFTKKLTDLADEQRMLYKVLSRVFKKIEEEDRKEYELAREKGKVICDKLIHERFTPNCNLEITEKIEEGSDSETTLANNGADS